jgi:hypothetical protein
MSVEFVTDEVALGQAYLANQLFRYSHVSITAYSLIIVSGTDNRHVSGAVWQRHGLTPSQYQKELVMWFSYFVENTLNPTSPTNLETSK